MSNINLMECRDVSFAYDGKTVVRELNFTVEAGDYLCVVGENGSGKSTLVKGLLRLKAPQSGQILMDDALRDGQIGYLPQQTLVQKDFPASVAEVVLSGRQNSRKKQLFYSKADKETAQRRMREFGIYELRRRSYRDLSPGQQQRVLLARALCATKCLLVLDEPVAGLDPVVTAELYEMIADINRRDGITVVMVSHDVASAVAHARHILHLSGRQLFFGSAADYAASDAGRLFLGHAIHNTTAGGPREED